MYTLEFTIQQTPDSPNALLGAHWTVRKRHADKWRRLVWAKVWHVKPLEPLKRAKLTLIRYSIKKMDADNARSSFKPICDALVHWGVIVDDNVNVVGEPIVLQEPAKMRQKSIRIKIEEIA